MSRIGLISSRRLRNIPKHIRPLHEYCFHLHDECVRLLSEYEAAKAHFVTVDLPSPITAERFRSIAATDAVAALRELGYPNEAKRIILNQITLALVSDFLHHLYEALTCFERRKSVVACNLLRKPLKDNLAYLCWTLSDPNEFYAAFTTGKPEEITQKKLGNTRLRHFEKALSKTGVSGILDAVRIHETLYNRTASHSFEMLFQHAVHLVTVQHLELKTAAENFNFIFKNLADDDIYEFIYAELPAILLFSYHVIFGLFEAIRPADPRAHQAAVVRSTFAYAILVGSDEDKVVESLHKMFQAKVFCHYCRAPLSVTHHNALRICLVESFRCTSCRRLNEFPFSWMF